MKKQKILITGGAGYIGSHAALRYLREGHEVVIIDNLSTGHKSTIDTLKKYGDLKFYLVDLFYRELLGDFFRVENNFDCILHFAANTSVSESVKDPEKYYFNNIVGSINLLSEIKNYKKGELVFSSSCAVYGNNEYLPIDEKHPIGPVNPYGDSKRIVERVIMEYSRAYGIDAVILRYFNVCGADEEGIVGDAKDPSTHLMQNAVRGALGIEPFKLTYAEFDTTDKSPIRDYLDVNDLIEAHYLADEYIDDKKGVHIFNLGTGSGNSVLEVVQEVEKVMDVKLPRTKGEKRKGEYAAVYADYEKAKKELGWEPKRSLEDSIKSLINWYTTNPRFKN